MDKKLIFGSDWSCFNLIGLVIIGDGGGGRRGENGEISDRELVLVAEKGVDGNNSSCASSVFDVYYLARAVTDVDQYASSSWNTTNKGLVDGFRLCAGVIGDLGEAIPVLGLMRGIWSQFPF